MLVKSEPPVKLTGCSDINHARIEFNNYLARTEESEDDLKKLWLNIAKKLNSTNYTFNKRLIEYNYIPQRESLFSIKLIKLNKELKHYNKVIKIKVTGMMVSVEPLSDSVSVKNEYKRITKVKKDFFLDNGFRFSGQRKFWFKIF